MTGRYFNPSRPVHLRICIKIKINLNIYFRTFCDASKGFMKAFWGTTKKCENKN